MTRVAVEKSLVGKACMIGVRLIEDVLFPAILASNGKLLFLQIGWHTFIYLRITQLARFASLSHHA
jgi:hypothetical protein